MTKLRTVLAGLLIASLVVFISDTSLKLPKLVELYNKTAPSVVLLNPYEAPRVEGSLVIGDETLRIVIQFPFRPAYSHGSGVFIRKDGVILTAAHLVRQSTLFRVETFDGKVYKAVVMAIDRDLDLALLKVVSKDLKGIKVAKIGKERPSGWPVYAIGNPLEYRFIITDGIVSGYVDENLVSNTVINPGNSGGGLFDAITGKLHGITVGIATTTNPPAFVGHSVSVSVGAINRFIEKALDICG